MNEFVLRSPDFSRGQTGFQIIKRGVGVVTHFLEYVVVLRKGYITEGMPSRSGRIPLSDHIMTLCTQNIFGRVVLSYAGQFQGCKKKYGLYFISDTFMTLLL